MTSPTEAPRTAAGLRISERHAAECILNRIYADPDDDAAIVARAALRLGSAEAAAPASPASPDVVVRQRLNDEYMRGYRGASRMLDSLLAVERAAMEPIVKALRYPCREPVHQRAAKALDAMDAAALATADKPEPGVQAQPAPLDVERLHSAILKVDNRGCTGTHLMGYGLCQELATAYAATSPTDEIQEDRA